uniref:Uncharacterized protein n=1 Tax=Bactrocera latifrons TaxID=174628 RepID=A0A0K8WB15_BACLA
MLPQQQTATTCTYNTTASSPYIRVVNIGTAQQFAPQRLNVCNTIYNASGKLQKPTAYHRCTKYMHVCALHSLAVAYRCRLPSRFAWYFDFHCSIGFRRDLHLFCGRIFFSHEILGNNVILCHNASLFANALVHFNNFVCVWWCVLRQSLRTSRQFANSFIVIPSIYVYTRFV